MKLNCKIKLIQGGKLPFKKHQEDACYDLFVRKIEYIREDVRKVSLGVALQPQESYRVALYPRSSISKTGWVLANSVGVGDNNYTGEYSAYFNRVIPNDHSSVPFPYKVGDRCIQMELVPYNDIEFEVVDDLDETTRGSGGFGSTGKIDDRDENIGVTKDGTPLYPESIINHRSINKTNTTLAQSIKTFFK